jgi:hypothetical protein
MAYDTASQIIAPIILQDVGHAVGNPTQTIVAQGDLEVSEGGGLAVNIGGFANVAVFTVHGCILRMGLIREGDNLWALAVQKKD